METKLDYFSFQSSRLLQESEKQLLKNKCKQEATKSLTILMVSQENPRLVGYTRVSESHKRDPGSCPYYVLELIFL